MIVAQCFTLPLGRTYELERNGEVVAQVCLVRDPQRANRTKLRIFDPADGAAAAPFSLRPINGDPQLVAA